MYISVNKAEVFPNFSNFTFSGLPHGKPLITGLYFFSVVSDVAFDNVTKLKLNFGV
jgi:hypothetical protein